MEYAVIDDSKKKEQKQQNVSCNQNQVNLYLLSLHCQFWVESSVHFISGHICSWAVENVL